MIPPFDHNNVLPPHIGNPTDKRQISPYKASIIDLCKRFATSPERINILKGFVSFRLNMLSSGITNGFQWIDGSFSQNIEVIENRAPNDIDVVSYILKPSLQDAQKIIQFFPEFIDPKQSKIKYKVDHYCVEYNSNPLYTVEMTKYWIQLFSHNRQGVWKGMIEIPLYIDNILDNEALRYLNTL